MKKRDVTNVGQATRRGVLGGMAAATLAPLGLGAAMAQTARPSAPAAPTPPAAPAASAARPPMPQGGRGPLKVLFITQYKDFDRDDLFKTLDSMGDTISWTHVENPVAQVCFEPRIADQFDVFLFYDAYAGRDYNYDPATGRPRIDPATGRPHIIENKPSQALQDSFRDLLRRGDKGFVFMHHAIASWVHTWPEYSEVIGAAADWTRPLTVRGKTYPPSGYREGVAQRISVVDKTHPVMQGVEDFDIVDEVYLCPIFEDSVHPLTRTNINNVPEYFRPAQASHPLGSNMTSWVKTAENSPIVYLLHGHDKQAYVNESFRKILLNAINWAASDESKAWARQNPSKIFA